MKPEDTQSDTPRTDLQLLVGESQGHKGYVHGSFAKVQEEENTELERENRELVAALQAAQSRIRFLENIFCNRNFTDRYGDGPPAIALANEIQALLARHAEKAGS